MSAMACSQLHVLSADLEELQGALKTHRGVSPSGGGRLSRAGSAYNETWGVNEALTSSLWSPVAWKHFLEMANQLGVVAQGTQWWWAVHLELRHMWLQLPVAPLTQALGQVNCGFLIYKLEVNTLYVLHQIVRI